MPSVTTNEGMPTYATKNPLTTPHSSPVSSPIAKATYQGYCQVRNRPATIATKPITEPTDRSMPPVMITIVMPSAMMPNGAKLRATFPTLFAVPKVGSNAVITTMRASSATVTQKGWLAMVRLNSVCSLTPTTSEIAAWPMVISWSGGTDRSCDQAGDFLRRGIGGVLVRNLAAAPQNDDAVGDREYVRHAVADEDDRDALRLQAPDEPQHFGDLPHRDRRRWLVHQDQLGLG